MSPAEEPFGAGAGESLVPPRERQVRMRQRREGSPQSNSSCWEPSLWPGRARQAQPEAGWWRPCLPSSAILELSRSFNENIPGSYLGQAPGCVLGSKLNNQATELAFVKPLPRFPSILPSELL